MTRAEALQEAIENVIHTLRDEAEISDLGKEQLHNIFKELRENVREIEECEWERRMGEDL